MSISKLQGQTASAELWLPIEEVEAEALKQIKNICSLPWVAKVAVMPDVHYGKGATVGSVIAMHKAVSPAAVGVDIGCGMMAVKTNLTATDLPDDLKKLRSHIEAAIPVGFETHRHALSETNNYQLWKDFKNLSPQVHNLLEKAHLQMGTLGGGNHFIEMCLDTEKNVWLMLHSGSRNIGKTLADIHINKAKTLKHNQNIIDPELAVFLADTAEFKSYWHDLKWAQTYAYYNRQTMMKLFHDALLPFFPQLKFIEQPVNCHHNYVCEEIIDKKNLLVTRKGAIAAHQNEMGIIPGSMGSQSFIVRGLGNKNSLYSASHGAGRKYSRTKAKKLFNTNDLKHQTEGVECRKDKNVIDEIPSAYKDIHQVMSYQKDLVEIITELKQVICIKG